MAFLEIAGTAYDVIEMSEDAVGVYGDEVRTYNGRLRSNISAVKRVWTVRLNEMSDTTYRALRNTVETGNQLTVQGDALEAAYTCRISVLDGDYIRNKSSFLRGIRLRLEQV